MSFPFKEKLIGGKTFLREFKENIDTSELIWHLDREDRVVIPLKSSGWKLHGEPKMTFDTKRGVMRCGQAVIKNAPRKKYSKKMSLSSI